MARPDTFMPLMVGDYLKDTGHLTTEQHGAYLLLLMAYWARGGALVADDARLAATARLTSQQWAKNRAVLVEFFVEQDGMWINKRSEEEIERAHIKMQAKAKAGATAAAARWQSHSKRNANAMRPHNERNAKSITETCPSPSPSDTKIVLEENTIFVGETTHHQSKVDLPKKQKQQKALRWSPDAVVCEEWLEAAKEKRKDNNLPPIDLRLEAEKFANYWSSKAGGLAARTDWKRTWINWALTAKGAQNGYKSTFDSGGGTFQDAYERLASKPRATPE